MEYRFESTKYQDTERIAESIGSNLRGGEVVELISDVGGGKTTFVRGLARGINSSDHVASPTFTISRQYQGQQLRMYHYDFYRIDDDQMIRHEFAEQSDDKKAVRVVEWADVIEEVLPHSRIRVRIKSTGADTRDIEITTPKKLGYILGNVT